MEYEIFYGDQSDFEKGDAKDNLINFVRSVLK
jgi:hypothetical protein